MPTHHPKLEKGRAKETTPRRPKGARRHEREKKILLQRPGPWRTAIRACGEAAGGLAAKNPVESTYPAPYPVATAVPRRASSARSWDVPAFHRPDVARRALQRATERVRGEAQRSRAAGEYGRQAGHWWKPSLEQRSSQRVLKGHARSPTPGGRPQPTGSVKAVEPVLHIAALFLYECRATLGLYRCTPVPQTLIPFENLNSLTTLHLPLPPTLPRPPDVVAVACAESQIRAGRRTVTLSLSRSLSFLPRCSHLLCWNLQPRTLQYIRSLACARSPSRRRDTPA